MANFIDAFAYVARNEGGFSDHPNDPGGVTKYGISLRFLEATGTDLDKDGDTDADDVRALTLGDALNLYQKHFWDALNLDRFKGEAVATRVFDMSVNFGRRRAIKVLQRAFNSIRGDEDKLKVDGKLGPKTKGAVEAVDPVEMMAALREFHEKYYRNLVEKRPDLEVFLNGWLIRARK